MKKLKFSIVFTICTIFFLITSCEKEENTNHNNQTNKITRKKISLTDLKNHESIFNKFDEISKKN